MQTRLALAAAILLITTAAPAAWGGLRADLLQSSATTFSRPHDLVLSPDKRWLYVADVGNDAVQVLDPRTLAVAGTIGAGELDSPHDVAFDKEGRLLVADSGNDRIAIYEVDGVSGRLAGELSGDLSSPEGVVALADGRVFATNAGSHTVTIFERGLPTATFGSGGSGEDDYVRPHDIDVDGAGRLYVTDPGNGRIHILDTKLRRIALLGRPAFRFNEPKYLALDPAGRLYVADQHNNVIRILDGNFHQLATIPPGTGGRATRLNRPEGVTVHEDRVWISDTYNNRILLYRLRERP
jgi:YVTN family beta-propeller protein